VTLRPAGERDIEWLVELAGHPEVSGFLSTDAAARLREPDEHGGIQVIEAGGEPVGGVRWSLANRRSRIARISSLMLTPSARGRGDAVAALRELVGQLRRDVGAHRVEAEVYGFNAPALRTFERAGFQLEGRRRLAYDRHGEWHDGVLFGLVSDDGDAAGRVFRHPGRVTLGDVAPDGRARLDAVARSLQDAAWADVRDSGLDDDGIWVVRRLRLDIGRFPRFDEALEVSTSCSGTGRLWAERSSAIRGATGGLVEATALWVHLDPTGVRPRPLPPGFDSVYGAAAAGRRVKARLQHPATPPAGAPRRPWTFRASELDLAAHVNNAAYWAILEEELAGAAPSEPFSAEIEHRAAGSAGGASVAASGDLRWIEAGGEVLASLRMVTA
jgi:acyl-ACP thioesterase/RimJ/RimL family protein N-acetyltransferase